MIIKISKDLKRQEFWANGNELAAVMGKDRVGKKRIIEYPESKKQFVHSFNDPILITDNHRICGLNPTVRDTLFSLLASRPRIVEYDDVSVRWDDTHKGVWCPSIDTVLLAKALDKLFAKNKNIKSAVEIGCGSGFLSKYALKKCHGLKSILINDINQYAIKCAMDNISDKRADFYVGDGLKKIKGKKFDLMICNPPYVPRPASIDDNPYEGVGVLKELLHNGQKYLNEGGILIINISSLCEHLVLDKKPQMKMQLLEKMEVPLKVNNILNNAAWVKYLLTQGMKKEFKEGYEFWQTLSIVMLENE